MLGVIESLKWTQVLAKTDSSIEARVTGHSPTIQLLCAHTLANSTILALLCGNDKLNS